MSLESDKSKELNDEHIDTEALRLHLPDSHQDLVEILRVFDYFNLEKCEKDAVMGRQMMMELQKRIDELGPNVVNELFKIFENTARDSINVLEEIKKFLFPALDVTFPAYHKVPSDESDDKRDRDGVYKSIVLRYLLKSLLIKLFHNQDLNYFIPAFLTDLSARYRQLVNERDVVTINALDNKLEEHFMLLNYLEFRNIFANLSSFRMREGDREMLSGFNDELFQQIVKDRVYDTDEIYTEDHILGNPLVEVFQNSSNLRYFRDEGITLVMLSNKRDWELYFRNQEDAISKLHSKERVIKDVRAQINGAIGDINMAKQMLHQLQAASVITRIPNSQNISIRWSDGQLLIPRSLILFKELFDEDEQDWVEMLRFSLLSKLRSMLVPEIKDPTVKVISDLKRRTKKKGKKVSMKKIRDKIFPRIRRKEFVIDGHTICSVPRKERKDHKVIGHKRKLPEGFYASPAAAERARQLGINLDFIIDEKNIKRYTETYVQTHRRGKEKISDDRKGKFRKKA